MIVVIGDTGTVGRAVAGAALTRGHEVLGVSRRRAQADWRHDTGDSRLPGFGWDATRVSDVAARTTRVVVAAGPVDFTAALPDLIDAHLTTVSQALQFARSCPQLERFVLVSSIVAVGETLERHPATWLPPEPVFRAYYEYVKHAAELLVRSSALPMTIVRPGHVLTGTKADDFGIFDVLQLGLEGRPVAVNRDATYWTVDVDVAGRHIVDAAYAEPGSHFTVDPASPTVGDLLDAFVARHRIPLHQLAERSPVRQLVRHLPLRAIGLGRYQAIARYADAVWDLELDGTPLHTDRSYVVRALDAWVERKAALR